jgi:hypothetical protein
VIRDLVAPPRQGGHRHPGRRQGAGVGRVQRASGPRIDAAFTAFGRRRTSARNGQGERSAHRTRHKNPQLILATIFDASLFLAFVGLGLWHRRRAGLHRGFMLLALLPFLNPALGRLISPMLSLPVELLAMVALLLRARRRKEPLRPYVVGLACFFVALGLLVGVMVGWPDLPERLWQVLYGGG